MYIIVDYDSLYKPLSTKGEELVNARYVKLPVKPMGKGLRVLLKHRNGLSIFGIWCLLLEAATDTKPENRGKLLNHKDEPASIEDIADSVSLAGHEKMVDEALSVLNEMGWIKYVSTTDKVRSDYGVTAELVPPNLTKENLTKENNNYISVFDSARKLFKGTKRGLETEFNNFKKHKDWKECLELLEPAIHREIIHKDNLKASGGFCPSWANFQTWINQRRWEQELPYIEPPKSEADRGMELLERAKRYE